MKRKIVACREELRMCEERAQEAENMEARADRNGLQLQIDWQDAELDLQVTQDDLDAAEFIIPSLERMNPVEDVKAELLEMLLQGGAGGSQVEPGGGRTSPEHAVGFSAAEREEKRKALDLLQRVEAGIIGGCCEIEERDVYSLQKQGKQSLCDDRIKFQL